MDDPGRKHVRAWVTTLEGFGWKPVPELSCHAKMYGELNTNACHVSERNFSKIKKICTSLFSVCPSHKIQTIRLWHWHGNMWKSSMAIHNVASHFIIKQFPLIKPLLIDFQISWFISKLSAIRNNDQRRNELQCYNQSLRLGGLLLCLFMGTLRFKTSCPQNAT